MPVLSIVCIAVAALIVLGVTGLLARDLYVGSLDPDAMLESGGGGLERFRDLFDRRMGGARSGGGWLNVALARADLRFRPLEWVLVVTAGALFVGLLLAVLLQNWSALVVGSLAVVLVAQLFVGLRQRRRESIFEAQLVDALLTLRSALRAGSSFPQALAAVARSTPAPCGEEFARVIREVELGSPLDRSLTNMVERNRSEDLALLVVAVQVHREVGGNLARTVDRISRVIQDRLRIKGDVRVLTAQPRLSGTALALLPVLLGGGLVAIQPNYFKSMLTDELGVTLLVVSLGMLLTGYFLMRRIARVDFY